MKYVKMLSLVAVVIAALVALMGTGTASATVLCTETPSAGTHCAHRESAGSEVTLDLKSGTHSNLLSSVSTITCKISVIGGKITQEGSTTSTVKISIDELTMKECPLTALVTILAFGTMQVHYIAGTDNGTLSLTGQEITTVVSTIFGNIHCIYRTENTSAGTVTGGSPAQIDVEQNQIPRLSTNALCDEGVEWFGTYVFTKPSGTLHVVAG